MGGALVLSMAILIHIAVGVASGRCAVRVEEDEVVFTLQAPGAGRVFLVGDFNNWNPTVEYMTQEGGVFVARMFLVAGRYRYKFVVDGKWIFDPDNPPRKGEDVSLLVLEETPAGLAIGVEREPVEKGLEALNPTFALYGRSRAGDDEEALELDVDVGFGISEKIVASRTILKSRDRTWTLSPLRCEIELYRGYLELGFARGKIVGFENDSTWSSRDPLGLFGDVGIYGYDFGFSRKGVWLEQQISRILFRAIFSDRSERNTPGEPIIPASLVTGRAGGGVEHIYRAEPSLDDADTYGGEILLDLGSVEAGYTRRSSRGMNPGLLAIVDLSDSIARIDLASTREYWTGHVFWAGARVKESLRIRVGLGRGASELHKLSGRVDVVDSIPDLLMGPEGEEISGEVPFMRSRKIRAEVTIDKGGYSVGLSYERDVHEFSEPVYADAEAEMDRIELHLDSGKESWRISGDLFYMDQRYGGAPPEFHFLSDRMNYWLDYEDRFTLEDLTLFDEDSYGGFSLRFSSGAAAGRLPGTENNSIDFRTGAVFSRAGRALRYVESRIRWERFLVPHVFIQVDERVAHYPESAGDGGGTYLDSYMEVGYRRNRMEFSLGFGFDPYIFDRVRNSYADIGREEYLRRALSPPPSRQAGGGGNRGADRSVRQALLDLEESLAGKRTLKLEWVLIF